MNWGEFIKRIFAGGNLCKTSAGNAAVEFALIAPVLLVFIFGIYEFGRAFWARNVLQFAVEETGRYALAHIAPCDNGLQTAIFNSKLAGVDPAQVNFQATQTTQTYTAGITTNYCSIIATYNFVPTTGLIPSLGTIVLTGQSQVPL